MATPIESPEEPWEIIIQGTKHYAAAGTRDVLILVSSESGGADIVAREKGELTKDDKERLKREGISKDCWEDDAKMARERYKKGSDYIKSVEVEDEPHMTGKDVLDKIRLLFNNTTQHGVILHYIGPGKKGTGDWCFGGKPITFRDILNLYTQRFTGKTLYLMSDCSYSGQWVESCKDFLDSKGVQPCGHSAKENKIQLKVHCSCQPDQIGYSLLCSARRGGNDKNTGIPYLKNPKIEDDQITCGEDFTEITCGKLPAEECALPRNFTFQEKRRRSHIELVKDKDDKGWPVWKYVIPEADLNGTSTFQGVTQHHLETQAISRGDPVTLTSGLGKEPPQSIINWVTGIKNGLQDLPSLH